MAGAPEMEEFIELWADNKLIGSFLGFLIEDVPQMYRLTITSSMLESYIPSREGFTFQGWELNAPPSSAYTNPTGLLRAGDEIYSTTNTMYLVSSWKSVTSNIQKSRIQFKNDTVSKWSLIEDNFSTLKGEFYFYNDAIETENTNHSGQKIYRPKLKIGTEEKLFEVPFLTEEYLTNKDIFNLMYNKVLTSTTTDGKTIYNNIGYKYGARIRSNGEEAAANYCAHTGYIAVKGGDTIRIKGYDRFLEGVTNNAINVYNSSYSNLGQAAANYANAGYGIFADGAAYQAYAFKTVVEETTGVFKWIVPPTASGVAFIRVSIYTVNKDGTSYTDADNLIVTVNTPIPTSFNDDDSNTLGLAKLGSLTLG